MSTAPIIVQKFGGSSVADAEKIKHVSRIIVDTFDKGFRTVAVISAMGDSTDDLVTLANQLCDNPGGREYDALLATGEMISVAAVAMAINAMGYKAVSMNGQQAGVHTEDLYNRARILEIKTQNILKALDDGYIVLVTGFQGVNSKGEFVTLGRGGSDTSAVALAGALSADRCDIYTDVRGVYSTDPRIVPEAVKIDKISYIEMMELARVGAQVLHPRAVELARQADIRLCKRSTFYLEDPGTMMIGELATEKAKPVTGIACDLSQARLAVVGCPDRPGIAAEIFGSLASENISVDMIIQTLGKKEGTNDIAFTINATENHDAMRALERVREKIGAESIMSDTEIAKVSIVGAGMIDQPGIAADMFEALSEGGINIKMISTSEIKISCLVDKAQGHDAVRAIHRKFFPEAHNPEDVLVNEKVGY
ncbi:MAG TPA: aspartate kinase [Coleofasciculaceae cyanobacterium]